MVNIYVEERVAQMRMAALEQDLARQQRVQAALAHHLGSRTQPTGWYGRLMRRVHRRMPAWTAHLNRRRAAEWS